MPLALLDAPEATRLERELDLRRRGYVPISSPDALFPAYKRQLPRCCTRQVVPGEQHSRLVWSHRGRSGIDPRAVAPLAIVRVADGVGPDPLDPPLDLLQVTQWLLDGDVEEWLLRPLHRLLLGSSCLLERESRTLRCLSHPVADPVLQDVATALGDPTMRSCGRRSGTRAASHRWRGALVDGPSSDLLWSAFGTVSRLARWYGAGVTGTTAWELARHGVRPETFDAWKHAGFTPDEAARWCDRGDAEACARLRDAGRSPELPVVPVPLPPAPKDRGLSGYDRWNFAKRGWTFAPCALCGASAPTGRRCRTCERQNRTTPLRGADWSAYQLLEELGGLYAPPGAAVPVACGEPKCQTLLSQSVLDEGAQQ